MLQAERNNFSHIGIVPAVECRCDSGSFVEGRQEIVTSYLSFHLVAIVLNNRLVFDSSELANPWSPDEKSEDMLIAVPAFIFVLCL